MNFILQISYEGVKNSENYADVINGSSLTEMYLRVGTVDAGLTPEMESD